MNRQPPAFIDSPIARRIGAEQFEPAKVNVVITLTKHFIQLEHGSQSMQISWRDLFHFAFDENRHPLTIFQYNTLNAIKLLQRVNGYSPNYMQIAQVSGLKSVSGVHKHIVRLEKYGYIKRLRETGRGKKGVIQIL